jgi:predicted nucleic-acid-binding protein
MIGLDTNILVRYLAQDDPLQSPIAADILESRVTEKNPGYISIVAMVETVWVLDRAYGLVTSEIAAALERILQADTLVVESEQEVFEAMMALKEGSGSFADALIGALGAKAGCTRTLTFDKSASRLPGFELVYGAL